jgi:putative membrane protein
MLKMQRKGSSSFFSFYVLFEKVNIPHMRQKPGLLSRLVVSSIAVFLADWILPGVNISSFSTAVGVAIVLGLLNATLKPLLIIITIPLTFMTLGLFLLIINAIIIGVADQWIDGLEVASVWTAILFSLLVSTISSWMYRYGERQG